MAEKSVDTEDNPDLPAKDKDEDVSNVRAPDEPDRRGGEEKSSFVEASGPTPAYDARGDGDNRMSGRNFASTFDQSGNADEPRR